MASTIQTTIDTTTATKASKGSRRNMTGKFGQPGFVIARVGETEQPIPFQAGAIISGEYSEGDDVSFSMLTIGSGKKAERTAHKIVVVTKYRPMEGLLGYGDVIAVIDGAQLNIPFAFPESSLDGPAIERSPVKFTLIEEVESGRLTADKVIVSEFTIERTLGILAAKPGTLKIQERHGEHKIVPVSYDETKLATKFFPNAQVRILGLNGMRNAEGGYDYSVDTIELVVKSAEGRFTQKDQLIAIVIERDGQSEKAVVRYHELPDGVTHEPGRLVMVQYVKTVISVKKPEGGTDEIVSLTALEIQAATESWANAEFSKKPGFLLVRIDDEESTRVAYPESALAEGLQHEHGVKVRFLTVTKPWVKDGQAEIVKIEKPVVRPVSKPAAPVAPTRMPTAREQIEAQQPPYWHALYEAMIIRMQSEGINPKDAGFNPAKPKAPVMGVVEQINRAGKNSYAIIRCEVDGREVKAFNRPKWLVGDIHIEEGDTVMIFLGKNTAEGSNRGKPYAYCLHLVPVKVEEPKPPVKAQPVVAAKEVKEVKPVFKPRPEIEYAGLSVVGELDWNPDKGFGSVRVAGVASEDNPLGGRTIFTYFTELAPPLQARRKEKLTGMTVRAIVEHNKSTPKKEAERVLWATNVADASTPIEDEPTKEQAPVVAKEPPVVLPITIDITWTENRKAWQGEIPKGKKVIIRAPQAKITYKRGDKVVEVEEVTLVSEAQAKGRTYKRPEFMEQIVAALKLEVARLVKVARAAARQQSQQAQAEEVQATKSKADVIAEFEAAAKAADLTLEQSGSGRFNVLFDGSQLTANPISISASTDVPQLIESLLGLALGEKAA